MNESIMHASKSGLSDEFLSNMRLWSMGLTLFASDDVIRAWNGFRQNATQRDDQAGFRAVALTAQLLLAMRKDCGHDGTKIRAEEILGLFVNDVPSLSKA